MFYAEINYPSKVNFNSIMAIIYLGLFPTAIAFQLRFHIISKAGPIFLSYVAYLIPVFAIIWGYIFLNEKINLEIMLGVILILLGVFISQKKPSKIISE
jgi:drug/metabolite transporter (DMT)-like permease